MSRILVVALVCALSLASVSFGFEAAQYSNSGYGPSGASAIRPSGLRFPDATVSVKTGGVEGGVPCATCGQFGQLGQCIPWAVLPWYGSWDNDHQGHHRWGGCRHCGGAGF
jgi:hypothetical protein